MRRRVSDAVRSDEEIYFLLLDAFGQAGCAVCAVLRSVVCDRIAADTAAHGPRNTARFLPASRQDVDSPGTFEYGRLIAAVGFAGNHLRRVAQVNDPYSMKREEKYYE